ncbi:MAG: SAM-dependent methyltransferase [Pseudonocardiales bacterium]|nr:SAM-dependent methyltransferase [Pseudonocardiales bacterium]
MTVDGADESSVKAVLLVALAAPDLGARARAGAHDDGKPPYVAAPVPGSAVARHSPRGLPSAGCGLCLSVRDEPHERSCAVAGTPPHIDTTVPHSARIWNYWLGGKDNYLIDRQVGEEILQSLGHLTVDGTQEF